MMLGDGCRPARPKRSVGGVTDVRFLIFENILPWNILFKTFCYIVNAIENQRDLTLSSVRKMRKTGLIHHVLTN